MAESCPDYSDRTDLHRAENRCLYSKDTLKTRSMLQSLTREESDNISKCGSLK